MLARCKKGWKRSAIPPLQETEKSGARFSWGDRLEARPSPGTDAYQSDQVGAMSQAKSRLAWSRVFQEPAPQVGADHRVSRPVRLETVEVVSMQERTRGGTRIVVPAARAVAGLAGPGYDPVPVHDGDIVVLAGRGVPAQQVVVVRTDFPGAVMMADVVKIGLGQGDAAQSWDQHRDPQQPHAGL